MSSQGDVTPGSEPAEVLVRVWPSLEKGELLSGAVTGLSALCGVQLWFPGHSRGCSEGLRLWEQGQDAEGLLAPCSPQPWRSCSPWLSRAGSVSWGRVLSQSAIL